MAESFAIPLDRRSTEQRTKDALREMLPEINEYIERAVEQRVTIAIQALAAAAFPALVDASSVQFEMRRPGTGVWASPPSMQHLVTGHAKGLPFRIVVGFDGIDRDRPERPLTAGFVACGACGKVHPFDYCADAEADDYEPATVPA